MISQSELRLSALRAFLGRIHSHMRLVKIKASGDCVRLSVILSAPSTPRISEDISTAAAEIIADFETASRIEEDVIISTAPLGTENIIEEGWIFQRAE